MNNELYRKLTSITLMTIMFAGGMTIAIPGETPVAIAQTGMLSVSATAAPNNSFGGPQIIEIIVDDPARSEIGTTTISQPHVTVDGDTVEMTQADTGKWYAYLHLGSDAPDAPPLSSIDTDSDKPMPSTHMLPGRLTPTSYSATQRFQTFDFTDDSDIDIVLGTRQSPCTTRRILTILPR